MARIALSTIGPMLREKRGNDGIRKVAGDIGISPATLSRVENGKVPDLDTFAKVCKWLGIDPGEVLGFDKPAEPQAETEERVIAAHLRADKTLNQKSAQALAEMILAAQRMIVQTTNRM